MKKVLEYLLNFIIIHLFFGVIWLNNYFGHTTGEEKIFHLLVPLDGVNPECYLSYLFKAFIPTLIISLILQYIINNYFKKKKIIYLFLITISLTFSFNQLDISNYLYSNIVKSNFIKDNYVDPSKTEITFTNKKNVIYIMLESMENTYSHKQLGGTNDINLIPNLSRIAKDNISFSNNDKLGGALYIDGSNFTVASMLTQTSGMPLKIDLGLAFSFDYKQFYTGKTIGDILYENGYNNYILMGSNSNYGARKTLYQNHHYIVSDVNTAINRGKMTKEDIVWWGYSDVDLFKYAKEDLSIISKKGKPFNYTIMTVDTHFEDGYLEKDCPDKFDNQYSNVINCSDKLINDFIEWIKEQDFYNDTVIIMVGDHISMDSNYFKNVSKDYERTTYNVFINTEFTKDTLKTTNRKFTQLDMLPTTISVVGGKIKGDRLGLGTNLFSNKKTIIEKYGYKKVKKELNKKSNYYNQFMGTK